LGTYWIAEAPVPIDATRLPRRSSEWSQRAECTVGPVNVSSPGKSGIFGSTSGPVPEIRTFAVMGPTDVSIRQRRASSSHAASSTSVFNRIFDRTPKRSTTRSR
jgi:hypothetical protein